MLMRDGIVLLEFTDLVNDRCLTPDAYQKAVQRGQVTLAQRGNYARSVLIDWASLAPRYQAMVRHHLGGDPVQLAKSQELERHMVLRPDDGRYIDEFKGRTGLMLTEEKRRALRQACKVMAFLDELYDMPQAMIRTQFGVASVLDLKRSILDYIKANGIDLPHSFPRLEERKRAYRQCRAEGLPGAAGLVHAGHGNKNRSRIVDPIQANLLEAIAADHRNLSYVKLCKLYNAAADAQRWPRMGVTTVREYLSKGAVARAVTLGSRGKGAFQDTYGMVIPRSKPTHPTYLWVHDATVYELLYQKEVNGKRSHHHRKHVMVVLDPFSYYPVGYAIGDGDGVELTKAAIKNAVEHVAQLTGTYALPWQVQSDKLGHVQLRQWYEGMGVTYTPAQARNARAKAIESWFSRHHTEFVQPYYPNWGGHNITASRRRQPNTDTLEAIKHSFPNEATVIEQIHEAMARERGQKAEAYRAALLAMGDRLKAVDRAKFLEVFGTKHPWQNELTNRGLCPTIGGQERVYNLQELSFQEHVGSAFDITYDPADLGSVLVSTNGGKSRYLVAELAKVPMALADHTPETRHRLAGMMAFKLQVGQQAFDRNEHNARQSLAVVNQIILAAQLATKAEPKERTLDITPLEEATVRGYALTNGSHKEALQLAQQPPAPTPFDPEKWAVDNL